MISRRYIGMPDTTGSVGATAAQLFAGGANPPDSGRNAIEICNTHASQSLFYQIEEQGVTLPNRVTSAGLYADYFVLPKETKVIFVTPSQVLWEIGSGSATTRTARQCVVIQRPESTK